MNMKPIMLLVSIAVGLAIVTYWFWPASNTSAENVTKPTLMDDRLGSTSHVSKVDEETTERSSAEDAEKSNAEDINWALCIDDIHADACLDEVTPLMLDAGVDGRQWSEIFGHFEQQMQRVGVAVKDPACMQSAYAPELGKPCAAREMFNMASALRYCLSSPGGASVTSERLDEAGVTDLSMHALAEKQRQFQRLQSAWLRRECDKVRETLASLPPLTNYPLETCNDCGFVEFPLGALADNIDDYRERAALLGDMDAARYYVEAKRSLDTYRVYDRQYILDVDDPKWAELVRETEDETLQVVTKIRQRDPALGFALMADYELTRLPQVAQEARHEYSDPHGEFYVDEDWQARAETAAVYKLAAERLSSHGQTINDVVFGEDTWNVIREVLDDNEIAALAPRVDALVDEYLPRTDTR